MFPEQNINIFGIRIDEAMIAATDLLVAGVCFYSYIKLNKKNDKSRGIQYFKTYFLLLGMATTWGALITHAFFYLFNDAWRVPGWVMSMIAVTFFILTSLEHTKEIMSGTFKSVIGWIAVTEVLIVISLTISTINFRWTVIHSAFTLLAIATPLNIVMWIRKNDKVSQLVLMGVMIFSLSGLVFSRKISPHSWFNHVDLAHTVLAIAVYVFFRAGCKLSDTNTTV